MTKYITYAQLKRTGVCGSYLRQFKRRHGARVAVTVAKCKAEAAVWDWISLAEWMQGYKCPRDCIACRMETAKDASERAEIFARAYLKRGGPKRRPPS